MDRGDALRLANGVYCLTASWFGWAPWDRYVVAALAASRAGREPVVLTGLSAVVLHGLPPLEAHRFLDRVTLLIPWGEQRHRVESAWGFADRHAESPGE
jgi:hypothetical protein